MSKPHIVAREFTRDEISLFLSALIATPFELTDHSFLFGGLSTTTVKVTLSPASDFPEPLVLKIFYPNMVPVEVSQQSMNICSFIGTACTTIKVAHPVHGYVVRVATIPPLPGSNTSPLQIPCILMNFIAGSIAADVAVGSRGADRGRILDQLGCELARIHSLAVQTPERFLSYSDGGAVELFKHANREYVDQVSGLDNPEFTDLYIEELKLFPPMDLYPSGIIHGDPFLDNVMVDASTHELTALVDFEDACLGPVIFDIGSAIAGCCFTLEPGAGYSLDWHGIELLLRGYQAIRPLEKVEADSLTSVVRFALLCNCAFRFMMYHGSPNADAYRDLFDKITYMRSNEKSIHRCMGDMVRNTRPIPI